MGQLQRKSSAVRSGVYGAPEQGTFKIHMGIGELMKLTESETWYQKAESGKFLEANGLVEMSMVPHKDNPKKVATGGNWAGQGK